MEKILEKYAKRRKKHTHASVLLASLALAVCVNVFLFSDAGQNLQASLVDRGEHEASQPDIYLLLPEGNEHVVEIVAGAHLRSVSAVHASLTYNPENIEITTVLAQDSSTSVVPLSDGMPTVVTLIFATPRDIEPGTVLGRAVYKKTGTDAAPLNLVETFFSSDATRYELSNGGIEL